MREPEGAEPPRMAARKPYQAGAKAGFTIR